jgi:hypothetical protein
MPTAGSALGVLAGLFGRESGAAMRTSLLWRTQPGAAPARAMYNLLAAYYGSNGLYEQLRQDFVAAGLWGEGLRGLRNPAFRIVEFYVAHLWPGSLPDALPIVTEREAIIEPIQQVWAWSGWAARKQVAARWLAMYGDLFIKVRSDADSRRVWYQMIDARLVTDFKKDDRGFINHIRIDSPQVDLDSAGNVIRRWSYVEVWDKATMTYREWRSEGDAIMAPIEGLGTPLVDEDIRSFGVDFIPIVHIPFRDTGELRGVGAFVPVLDKIDELNRVVTRLHQMGFRHIKTVWALKAGGVDGAGRPLPAPRLQTTPGTNDNGQATNIAYVGDDAVIPLPGNSELVSLVPDLNYEALLNIARDTLAEIETDMPEMAWYKLPQVGATLSGRAIRLMLGAAAARVEEARGNAESGLVRLDQMGLSIGQAIGVFQRSLGSYDGGDFDHSFRARDVFPLSDIDKAEADLRRAQAAQAYVTAGVPLAHVAMDVMEMSEDAATSMIDMAASQVDGGQPSGGVQ